MKKFRKLIPALALLLVSAVLMSTASYAWFSMNNKVTVTGMEVKTRVSSNLFIARDTIGASAQISADSSEWTNELDQVVQGILEPVSTADGLNFYYTVDANNDGSKKQPVGSSAYIKYDSNASASSGVYSDKFSEVYGVTTSDAGNLFAGQTKAVPYVDYVFQLKASNAKNTAQVINLAQLDLTYVATSSGTDNSTAHRVMVFVQDITGSTSTADPSGSSATYAVQSSANFENAVIASETSSSATEYVSAAQALATVPANETKYYKVVVRMWLEGQDTTCKNDTFWSLDGSWKLEIALSLEDSADGAEYITKK